VNLESSSECRHRRAGGRLGGDEGGAPGGHRAPPDRLFAGGPACGPLHPATYL